MKYIIIIILFFGLASCKNSTEPAEEAEPIGPLVPLAVDNYWIYNDYYLNNNDGTVYSKISDSTGYCVSDTSRISNGIKVFKFAHYALSGNYIFPETRYIYNGPGGLYYAGTDSANQARLSFDDLLFKYPVNEGETYKAHIFYYNLSGNYFTIPDTEIVDYTCVSTNLTFLTPAGAFNCVVYKARINEGLGFYMEVYYFYKPGLGLVGTVQILYRPDKSYAFFIKTALTNYKLN